MGYSERFRLVIEAIEKERQKDPSAGFIELRQTKENKLNNTPIDEIKNILRDMEFGAKAIKIDEETYEKEQSTKPESYDIRKVADHYFDSGVCFIIQILDTYEEWLVNYNRTVAVEDLAYPNLLKILEVLSVIQEKAQLASSPNITIDLGYTAKIQELKDIEKYGEPKSYRLDVLSYLRQEGVINDYQLSEYETYGGDENAGGTKALISVNISKFKPFFEAIKLNYKQRPKEELSHIEPPSPKEFSSLPVKTGTPTLKLPPNTKWEEITIKFINGNDVDIKIKDKTIKSDFKEMGFEDKKKRLPNQQWEMLEELASHNGEIDWNTSIASFKLKKTKQLLSQTLKAYFHINEDPFLPYKQEKSYKIRISLIST